MDLKKMLFVGIDGLPTPDGGIKSVMDGHLGVTYVYPTGGAEAIDWAVKILKDKVKPPRRRRAQDGRSHPRERRGDVQEIRRRVTSMRTLHTLRCLLPALAAALLAGTTAGPARARGDNPAASLGSPLAGLALARTGTTRHEGSWDRKGGNDDFRRVEPGQTLTLLDYQGAGVIRRFWVTIAPRSEMTIHRQAILRMYWDGETEPSVRSPPSAISSASASASRTTTSRCP